MPGPISSTQLALINAAFGGLMALRGYTGLATTAAVLAGEVVGVGLARAHPELVAPTAVPYGARQFALDVGAGLLGWALVALLAKHPPNLYDGVPVRPPAR